MAEVHNVRLSRQETTMSKSTNSAESTVSHILDSKSIAAAKQHADSMAAGVSREFSNFITDIEDLLKETAALTGDDLNRAKAALSARVSAAKESIDGASNSVAEQVRKSGALTNEYVHEQPWKAIGAVAAVAFVLGLVFTRRG
ncbi:MAG: ElaB/YqjD/DUF883 family membrane-anchored ribosome-binding protein [Pseudomonas sp.]|jgi:ElaB/YqjD/DUF883 family membrane-anchored ribosome-binding protein